MLLHCSVDPGSFTLQYDDGWQDQERCWEILRSHPSLSDKLLPEKSDAETWRQSIQGDFKAEPTTVVFIAEVEMSSSRGWPTMKLILHRLKREKSCRLYRRFGSDRFLWLLFPSLHSWKPRSLLPDDAEKTAARWLTTEPHSVAGRRWAAFYIRAEKKKKKKKTTGGFGAGQEQIFHDRILFFAEDGHGFGESSSLPERAEPPTSRTKCKRDAMLDWLLQSQANSSQPCLKFFSRISLGR